MEGRRVEKFYDVGKGEELVNSSYFPTEIAEYLREEKKVISQTFRNKPYEGMLEVGCMNGRNINVASELGIRYIGIDIVDRFIQEARERVKKLRTEARAVKCDASNLSKIKELLDPSILAVFPFNSFGNVISPYEVLNSVSRRRLDSLILTYRTDSLTTRIRGVYLRNSIKDLRLERDEKGVVFSSTGGMRSYAYHPIFIRNIAELAGFSETNKKNFSSIGVAYYLRM